jgi:hypothetical protein
MFCHSLMFLFQCRTNLSVLKSAGLKDFVFIDYEDIQSCQRAIDAMNNNPFDSFSSGPMKVPSVGEHHPNFLHGNSLPPLPRLNLPPGRRCALRLLKASAFENGPLAMTAARHHTVDPAPAPATHAAVRRALLATTAAAAPPPHMPGTPLPFAPALLPDATFRPKGTEAGLRRVLGPDLAAAAAAEEEEEAARTDRTQLTNAPGNATAGRRTGPARASPAERTVSRETAT